jgi:hypothetical protein
MVYSIPAPGWNYATIYNRLEVHHEKLENLLKEMATHEKPIPETYRNLSAKLDEIEQGLNSAFRLMNS